MKLSPRIYLKIGFMILILVMVVQGIQYFRSQDFVKTAEGVFDSGQQSLNWCPVNAARVKVGSKDYNYEQTGELVKKICPLPIGNFDAQILSEAKFVPVISLFDPEGNSFVIEGDLQRQIFRYEGLPFTSQQLDWVLKKF